MLKVIIYLFHGMYKYAYSKTNCSNREIPIHPEIINIIMDKYYKCMNDNETLFKNLYWNQYMNLLNMKHNPHDTRYTFSSNWTECGLDCVGLMINILYN